VRQSFRLIMRCALILFTFTFPVLHGVSARIQEKRLTQTAGVDNTKMGAYRALAELSFQAFQKGDHATAAKLARILERTWDKGEEGDGERSLAKTNNELFEQIDAAMDAFIKPLIGYEKSAPDPAKTGTAYTAFLEKLKQAD
jgi:hypothetical protein